MLIKCDEDLGNKKREILYFSLGKYRIGIYSSNFHLSDICLEKPMYLYAKMKFELWMFFHINFDKILKKCNYLVFVSSPILFLQITHMSLIQQCSSLYKIVLQKPTVLFFEILNMHHKFL